MMSRSKYGIHMANSGDAHIDEMLTVGFDSYFDLHINTSNMNKVREKQSSAEFIVRWFDEDIMGDNNPRKKAQEIVDWAYTNEFYNIVPGNELNLRCEHKNNPGTGDKENWDTYVDYEKTEWWLLELVRYGKERDIYKKIKWGRPAESPGHSEDSNDNGFIVWEKFSGSLKEYDFITIHSYWNDPSDLWNEWTGMRWKRKLAILEKSGIDKPVYITEFNRKSVHGNFYDPDSVAYRGEVLDFYAELYKYPQVVAAHHFIWCSSDPSFYDLSLLGTITAEALTYVSKPGASVFVPEVTEFEALKVIYGEGFAFTLTNIPDMIGKPLQNNVQIATQQEVPFGYDAYAFSFLQTTKGIILWRKFDNRLIISLNIGKVMFWNGVKWV